MGVRQTFEKVTCVGSSLESLRQIVRNEDRPGFRIKGNGNLYRSTYLLSKLLTNALEDRQYMI